MTSLTAARWQMGLSLAFHMVFAAIGIGLPLLLVIVETLRLRTGKPHYAELAHTWAKITGMLFAVGAVSGTALSFELGLLWPRYTEMMGPAVGHLFALEGFAFFIEAIFIGLYLYGGRRLSPRLRWFSALCIAVSGMLSGIFVLGVNAWMQVPVGFIVADNGRIIVTDPLAIFKQYGWFTMALHSTLACYIALPFAVAAIYASAWLRGSRTALQLSAIRISMAVGGACAILQPISGDLLAKFVYRSQPAKFAAMEGHFVTQSQAPMRIGGLPDEDAAQTRWAIEVPGLLSFLAAHDTSEVVTGLNDIPRSEWPPVAVTHLSFQVMLGCGLMLVALTVWFWIAWWRRKARALDSRPLLWAMIVCGPLGFIALEAGWMVTEIGRQPWVIQQVMRTADAVTPAPGVLGMFLFFTMLYMLLGSTVVALLLRIRRKSSPGREGVPHPSRGSGAGVVPRPSRSDGRGHDDGSAEVR